MDHIQTRAAELLRQMTLEEKAALCSGSSPWTMEGVERLGLSGILVSDGPHGLCRQERGGNHMGLGTSVPATCFPMASVLASSWDPALARAEGVALGEECRQHRCRLGGGRTEPRRRRIVEALRCQQSGDQSHGFQLRGGSTGSSGGLFGSFRADCPPGKTPDRHVVPITG